MLETDLHIVDGADLQFVPDDITKALDAYIATLPPGTSRPAAIHIVLHDWLIAHGFLRYRESPEGTH